MTHYNYDSLGSLSSKVSPIGTETYSYDQYNRLTTYKLNGVIYATVHYDSDGRVASVDYPTGMNLTSIGRDSLQRTNKVTYQVGDTTLSDEVILSTSGDVLSGTQNGVAKSYTYDAAGRLTGAVIGGNTFGYEFGTPDASCSGVTGNNPNTSKSGNRTKYTLNGQSTTYCYDMADRLLASSNAKYTNVQYDSHGNTTSLGDATHATSFGYDANDRNTSISETYAGKTEKVVTYDRDVSDRLLRRNYKIDGNIESDAYYGYTADSDSPSFVMDGAGTVVQKYLSLPGGVSVTINPQSSSAGVVTYSLSNLHGDIMATVNADGLAAVQAPTGPFGEILPTSGVPNNTVDGASFAYVGAFKKTTDTDFAISPTQMGARVYIAELGRFLQTDPVDGGTDNEYAYVNDPINDYDLNGQWGFGDVFNWVKNVVKSAVRAVKKVVVTTVKKIVKRVTQVVAAAKFVYTYVVKPVVRVVVRTEVQRARAVVKAIKAAPKKILHTVAKYGDAISMGASIAAVGLCATGVGCGVGLAISAGIGATVSAAQSYDKHHDFLRAGIQAGASALLDKGMTAGLGGIATKAFGASRIGLGAVNLHGIPFTFLAGMGVESAVDWAYDKV